MIFIQPSRNNNSYQPPTQPTHPHADHAENITVRITTRPAQPPSITTSNTHHSGNLCHAGITQHTRTHMHATSTQPTMTMHQQNSTNQYHLAGHKHKVLVHHAIEFSNNIRTQHKQPTPTKDQPHAATETQCNPNPNKKQNPGEHHHALHTNDALTEKNTQPHRAPCPVALTPINLHTPPTNHKSPAHTHKTHPNRHTKQQPTNTPAIHLAGEVIHTKEPPVKSPT